MYGLFGMVKCLGVDVGSERVGIAVSDDGGSVAFPLEVVERDAGAARLLALIGERGIEVAVFGRSVDFSGGDNPVMADVRDLADAVRGSARVVFEPEQFSTQAAKRLGKGSDAEAAAIILQSYLDRQRDVSKDAVDFD